MKYKGFNIIPVYYTGSDFKITKDGRIKNRKPISKDIEYYEIIDNGERWIAEYSIEECKKTIDEFLAKIEG